MVDDDPTLLTLLVRQLRKIGLDVDQAATLDEARGQLSAKNYDVLVSDVHLADGAGLDLAREVRESRAPTAIVLISGDPSSGPAEQAMEHDVDEYLVKPFGREQLGVTIEHAIRRRRERQVQPFIEHLGRAVQYHDEETAEHVKRMSRSCALVASELGWGTEACIEMRTASAVHDIGKVGVPDAVLRKPGKLNHEERALIESHAEIGYDILRGSPDPVMALAATIALTHHERFDGTGYPRRLAQHEIPIEGRIAAVADVFDALTHDRVYRRAFSLTDALEVVRKGSGTHFDPAVVAAFENVKVEIKDLHDLYPDGVSDELTVDDAPAEDATRVLFVEDHDAVARGIELLLRREGFEIAGTARNLTDARRILERRRVDVALLDLRLGDEDGLDLIPELKQRGSRALVYTGRLDADAVASARRAGADGVAAKAGPQAELMRALRAVTAGETYVDARFDPDDPDAMPSLTPRESEIVALLASGLNGEEIAGRLVLSPATVRTHIRNAMARVDARTRAHLVTLGAEQGVRPSAEVDLEPALAS